MKISIIADFTLLIVALIWGSTFVLVQNAISFLEPLTFNAVRFFIAGLFLALWLLLFNREQLKQLSWKLIGSGSLMGCWLFLGYSLQTIGLVYTTSSKAGFITGLNVVLVPLFLFIIYKKRPTRNAIIGVLMATAGLYLLTMGDTFNLNFGDILVLFCAVSFALHIIFTGRFTSQYPSLLLTVIQIIIVSLLCSISSFFLENWQMAFNPHIIANHEVIIALVITSLLATAFAFFAQTMFQKYTTPTRVALIFAMEPVFAALTAYFWNSERLSIIEASGCLFILIGMVLSELPKRHAKKAQQAVTN